MDKSDAVLLLAFLGFIVIAAYVGINTSLKTELAEIRVVSKKYCEPYSTTRIRLMPAGKSVIPITETAHHPARHLVVISSQGFCCTMDNKQMFARLQENQVLQAAVTFRFWKGNKCGIARFN